jgi:tryptophanyl-tRNA synthetase
MVMDYLAAGIDPERTPIFTHSAIPALNQLMLPFLSLVSEAELQRNPTVKAEQEASGHALTGLLLTYPVHQACDILFCKGNIVPVGKDQLPHIEQTRLIARRFNDRYGKVFPEPDGILSDAIEIPGLDGRKMSKSYGNSIMLGATAEETAKLIKKSKSDSDRNIYYDKENRPEVSALLTTAALCSGRTEQDIAAEIGDGGAGMLKRIVTEAVNGFLAEHRERRAVYERAGGNHEVAIADDVALRSQFLPYSSVFPRTSTIKRYRKERIDECSHHFQILIGVRAVFGPEPEFSHDD